MRSRPSASLRSFWRWSESKEPRSGGGMAARMRVRETGRLSDWLTDARRRLARSEAECRAEVAGCCLVRANRLRTEDGFWARVIEGLECGCDAWVGAEWVCFVER